MDVVLPMWFVKSFVLTIVIALLLTWVMGKVACWHGAHQWRRYDDPSADGKLRAWCKRCRRIRTVTDGETSNYWDW